MKPGIYPDIPDAQYHGDHESLSSSGARKLLPPSCPALFRHEQLHGQRNRDYFDEGSAVHRLVLGVGPKIEVVQASDWRTKAAKQARATAYRAGRIPLLPEDAARVRAMADAVLMHERAGDLLIEGTPELSFWWDDPETGVQLRARPDWLTDRDGRVVMVDLKTTGKGTDPRSVAKAIATHGYYMQHPWYYDAVRAMDLDDDPGFVFVFVSDTAPHLVAVVELDADDVELGALLNRRAIDIYAKCRASDSWPAYGEGITRIKLPAWVAHQTQEILTHV